MADNKPRNPQGQPQKQSPVRKTQEWLASRPFLKRMTSTLTSKIPTAGKDKKLDRKEIGKMLFRPIVIFLVVATIVSPFIVRFLLQTDLPQPNWFLQGGVGSLKLAIPAPAVNWPTLTSNVGQYMPWLLWFGNVPLLLLQLYRERKLANEMSDFWIVLVAITVFWFVRAFPTQFGLIGGQMGAWIGGVNPIPWQPGDLVPAAAIATLVVAYIVTIRGRFDWTPVTVTAVMLAVIFRAYNPADGGWAKLFLAIGLLTGFMEVVRQPLDPDQAKQTKNRAAVLSLVGSAVLIFLVLAWLISSFLTSQINSISAPPSWYVSIGRLLYSNAAVVGLLLGAYLGWQLRWRAGKLLVKVLVKLSPKKGWQRLTPTGRVRFYDSTLLAHYCLIAVWLLS